MRATALPDEARVVITGTGAVTACGPDAGALMRAVREGRSALAPVTLDDGRTIGGGAVKADWFEPLEGHDPATALAVAAATEAVQALPDALRRALAVFVANGKPGMQLIERLHRTLLLHGPASIPSDFILNAMPCAPADAIAARFGCAGVRLPFIGACSTGLDAVAMAAQYIRAGRATAALAGSCEASLTPLVTAAFERMRVLATDEADPRRAVRPFARDRHGFLIGEGAGVVLIESLASARARHAAILGEVSGWAVLGDAHHAVALTPDGAAIARAITGALDAAGIAPGEIGHINAHGTATRLNDAIETRGIRTALGRHADAVKVCSTKPVTGHLLSASGSVELLITLEAMRAGFAPATLNLDDPDPNCDLDFTPGAAVACPLRHALVLNYGFGGHVGAVVLSQWTGR